MKMPYSCHRPLYRLTRYYFSQNLTVRSFFSYLHIFLKIINYYFKQKKSRVIFFQPFFCEKSQCDRNRTYVCFSTFFLANCAFALYRHRAVSAAGCFLIHNSKPNFLLSKQKIHLKNNQMFLSGPVGQHESSCNDGILMQGIKFQDFNLIF